MADSLTGGNELVPVAMVMNPVEAEGIKAMLESYGIPALLKSDTLTNSMMRGINVGPMAEIRVMVPEGRAEEAQTLLSAEGGSDPENGNAPGEGETA